MEQSLAFGQEGRSPDGPNDRVCGAVRLVQRLVRCIGLKRRRSGSGVGGPADNTTGATSSLSMSRKMSNFTPTNRDLPAYADMKHLFSTFFILLLGALLHAQEHNLHGWFSIRVPPMCIWIAHGFLKVESSMHRWETSWCEEQEMRLRKQRLYSPELIFR